MGSRRYETSRNISRLELIFHRNFLRAPFDLKYLKEGIEFTRKRWAPFFRKIENSPFGSYLILPRNFLPFRIPSKSEAFFKEERGIKSGWKPFPRDQNFFLQFPVFSPLLQLVSRQFIPAFFSRISR